MSATLQAPPTRHGLLAEAKHVVLPEGIVSTAFPAVEATCRQIGIGFDPWQQDLNRAILAKNAAGLYAADTVAISIPRQVGKTYDIGALVFADSIINPGTTTVWTAHRFKVARETFDSLRSMAISPAMAAHVDPDAITTGAGNECIPFRNRSRIVFAARERGAIRGFTKVRRLILDEAQILTESALSDMVPTLNQAVNPQIIMMGTPPKPSDPAEVFSNFRAEALAGNSEGVLWVEFGAPAGSKPDDRHAWKIANASYPLRTPASAILRMRKLLTVEDFMREALGIWDSNAGQAVITSSVWESLFTAEPPMEGRTSYGVKFSLDGSSVALAACIRSEVEGEDPHVELVDVKSLRDGRQWLVDWLVERKSVAAEIVIDGKDGAGALANDLRQAGVSRRVLHADRGTLTFEEAVKAHSMFLEAVKTQRLTHFGQPLLNRTVEVAGKRPIGNAGGWGWRSLAPDVDIVALDSVTLAYYGAMTSKRKPGQKMQVSY
jgi:hypothetical protein